VSPITTAINATNFVYLDVVLDIILHSTSLADLCERTVTTPQTNGVFAGAHVLLNTDGRMSYDSGYGQNLPINHLEIAKAAITSQKVEFRSESGPQPAMLAIPFLRYGYPEAIGILVMSQGVNENYLAGDLAQVVAKLTALYLKTKTI
jgi:hypothetical protein